MTYHDTQPILVSSEQVEQAFRKLVFVLQQIQNNPSIKTSRILPMLSTQTIFLIDTQQERGNFLAQRLATQGYRPLVVTTPLEAYTLYLQGVHIPFAIIVSGEDAASHFFLHRLIQQSMQKYHWDMPIIPLVWLPSTAPFASTPSIQAMQPAIVPPPTPIQQPALALPPPIPAASTLSAAAMPLPSSIAPTPIAPTPEISHITTAPLTSTTAIRPLTAEPAIEVQIIDQIEERPAEKITLNGQNLGRYQIIEPIGNKQFSDVYRTYDRLREEHVALKALQLRAIPGKPLEYSDGEYSLFKQEKDLLTRLQHPHILPVVSHGKSYVSGVPFLYKTMPYCKEGSLEKLLLQRATHTLTLKEVGVIVMQIASALQHAHEQEVVYRNFKLANILIRERFKNTDGLHVYIADFVLVEQALLPQQIQATYPYMAPECWQGHYQPASDQYGLAALAYELLVGRPIFQAQSKEIMKHLHQTMIPHPPSQLNRNIPKVLDNVLLRAIAKRQDERFGSVALFARAFQQCVQ